MADPRLQRPITIEVMGLGNLEFKSGTSDDDISRAVEAAWKKTGLTLPPNNPYVQQVYEEAKFQGIDPHLALRVAAQESKFDPKAVSPRGAVGLFQHMPKTATELGIDPRDPTQSIEGGVRYLGQLLKQYGGDVPKSLAAYNWGMGNLDTKGMDNAPTETKDYVSRLAGPFGSNDAPMGTPTLAGVSSVVPEASAALQRPSVGGSPASPPAGLPQTREQRLKQVGRESSLVDKFGLGVAQSALRTSKAVGLTSLLKSMGVDIDPQREQDLSFAVGGAGIPGMTGDLVGTGAQAAAGGTALSSVLPASLARLGVASPRLAAYVGAPASAAAVTGAMTPGDLETRAVEGAKAAALTLPISALARTFATPVQMSDAGRRIRASTGETPPVHIGAESEALTGVGTILRNIPFLGSRLVAGENRVFDAGMRQLWQQATPPGAPNLLVASNNRAGSGQLFGRLKTQFDDAYDSVLLGARIPVSTADRRALTQIIDNSLVPADAARVYRMLGQYFPQRGVTSITGTQWKELQEIIRSRAGQYKSSTDASQKIIGDTLGLVDDHLVTMRNRGLSAPQAQRLDDIDMAYSSRKLLESAATGPNWFRPIDPQSLASAVRSRTSEGGLARGYGTGQQTAGSLADALGDMSSKPIASALWGASRLTAPSIAGAVASPALGAVPALGAAAANWIGAGPRGANLMFGETAMQRSLADFLRRNPQAVPSASAGLELQTQD